MKLEESLATLGSDDERQELKEAIADALLESIRRRASGEGPDGRIVLGGKPSQRLSSGFILPRLNAQGDDEANDIRIAAHGLDFAVLPGVEGVISLTASCSVYVRVLPTADELFADDGVLIPRADFSNDRKREMADLRRAMRRERIREGMTREEKRDVNEQIRREIYARYGVVIPQEYVPPAAEAVIDNPLPVNPEEEEAAAEELVAAEEAVPPVMRGVSLATRLRIPNPHSRGYEVPSAWLRVDAPAVQIELTLPVDITVWRAAQDRASDELQAAIRNAVDVWVASEEGQQRAWRRNRHPMSEDFWSEEAWNRYLDTMRAIPTVLDDLLPSGRAMFRFDPLPVRRAPFGYSIRIAIENEREQDEKRENGLFLVGLTAQLPRAALVPMGLERVRRSYHLEGFLSLPAIGLNGGVEEVSADADRVLLRTTWMPRYVLPKLMPRSLPAPGVETRFAALAQTTFDVRELGRLSQALLAWVEGLVGPPEGADPDLMEQRSMFERDVQAWHAEARRIQLGVDLISTSRQAWEADAASTMAAPYRAWVLMNRSFADRYPPSTERPNPAWRLFQLAFVLSHVPTLASRIPGFDIAPYFDEAFDEGAATLLYMATGGGKTEAFFGVETYALFLDRLRGKHRGITAMMHYPLRLLTVQQAQRLAKLLAKAELVRRAEKLLGAPFEIGFWVGNNNTPNDTMTEAGELRRDIVPIPVIGSPAGADEAALMDDGNHSESAGAYRAAQLAWNKLPTCPFCDTLGTALRLFPAQANRLGIVCQAVRCDWNRAHPAAPAGHVPLPFLLTDADIYRRAPSVILGTVDKLALIGQSISKINKIAGMFGLVRRLVGGPDGLLEMTSPGGEPISPAWPEGIRPLFDPFPSLIIQDEMHLLDESLGTFGGLFETSLFQWLREIGAMLGPTACRLAAAPDRVRLPHVIGATATASDVERHVRAIYQKTVVQFPHPGPGLHDGFYVHLAGYQAGSEAALARAASPDTPMGRELAAPWARVYASIMTNGRKHTVTTLAVLAAHAAAITRWMVDLRDPATRLVAVDEMVACISHAPWRDRRIAALQSAPANGKWAALLSLLDLHRIMLTYVTNKKGGDQILSALNDEVREAHRLMGPRYSLDGPAGTEFATALISGGVDIGTIQGVIDQAEKEIMNPSAKVVFDPEVHHPRRGLREIVATSAVSHGVDVENFNAMAFAGLPSDIAEYIQASSRVGRTHVGFSILVPTPQIRRDRYVVEVHQTFHRLLERMIPPPAAERWAERAIIRSVPSLIQTWLAGVYHQRVFIAAPVANKGAISLPDMTPGVSRIMDDNTRFNECVTFIENAFGVNRPSLVGGPTYPAYYRRVIREEVLKFKKSVDDATCRMQEFWDGGLSDLPRPMTSLRDVQGQGIVRPTNMLSGRRFVDHWTIVAAMTAVRSGSSRRAAGAELDADEVGEGPRRAGGGAPAARGGPTGRRGGRGARR